MGIIFQNFNLVDELNVEENVELPLVFIGSETERTQGKGPGDPRTGRGWVTAANTTPSQLSGGQQQRVAFARAIVNQPNLSTGR